MTAKEKLRARIDRLSEEEAAHARIVVEGTNGDPELDVIEPPEAWKTFEDGTPQPDWTALIREDRDRGH